MRTGKDMMEVLGLVAKWARVIVLLLPLEEFCSAAKVTGGVFGDSSLLGGRESPNGISKGGPIDGVYAFNWFVSSLGPIFHYIGLG